VLHVPNNFAFSFCCSLVVSLLFGRACPLFLSLFSCTDMSSPTGASGSVCSAAGEEELSADEWVRRVGKDGEVALVDRPPGGDANCVDGFGTTALMWACARNHIAVVRALLAMPGIDVDKRSIDVFGWTAGHLACHAQDDDPGVLELLVSHGADMTAVNNDHCTPLHCAARNGKVRMASFLLSLPAVCDALHLRDVWGLTAEVLARSEGHDAIADMIAEAVCCLIHCCYYTVMFVVSRVWCLLWSR
jgi:ankyrin repeat protein